MESMKELKPTPPICPAASVSETLLATPQEDLVHATAQLHGMADEDHDERELDDDPDVVAGHREVVAAVGRDLLGELEKGPHAREAEKAHADRLDHLDRDVAAAEYILAKSDPSPVKSSLSSPDDEMHCSIASPQSTQKLAMPSAVL